MLVDHSDGDDECDHGYDQAFAMGGVGGEAVAVFETRKDEVVTGSTGWILSAGGEGIGRKVLLSSQVFPRS